jgi:hypothetical protein
MNARRVSLALQFLAHSALAGYVTVALAGLLELLLGLLTGSDRSLDFYFWGPTFLAPGLIGLAGGFFVGRRSPRLLSWFVFLIPLILGIWELVTWIRLEPHGNEIAGLLRDNFLGTRCGASECLEELLITAPLIASIAYAMGAEFGRLCMARPRPTSASMS